MLSHKIYLLLLIMGGFISELSAEDSSLTLRHLDEQKIEQCKETISRSLNQNKVTRWIVNGACLAGVSYLVYKWFLSGSFSQSKKNDAELKKGEEAKWTQEGINKVDQILGEWKKKQEEKERDSFKNGFLKFGKEFIMQTTAIMLFGRLFKIFDNKIDSVIGTIYHPITLEWFLQTQANVFIVLNELEKIALYLIPEIVEEGNSTTVVIDSERTYYTEAFVITWEIVVQQLEATIAFMQIKLAQKAALYPMVAVRLDAVIQNIFKKSNELCDQFALQLHLVQLKHSASTLVDDVRSMRTFFEKEFASFINLDVLKSY